MASFAELRERVCAANLELPRLGLVLFTFGNVSGIDRERGVFAIKPSGVPYEELTPEKMALVDLDCRVLEGDLNPSSDTKTHAVLYRNFPHIGGVAHTHSTFATVWAQAMRGIPCLGTTHADHVPGEIPCTRVISDDQIRGDYEEETGNQILARFRDLSPANVEMILVACHGPFTWGKTRKRRSTTARSWRRWRRWRSTPLCSIRTAARSVRRFWISITGGSTERGRIMGRNR